MAYFDNGNQIFKDARKNHYAVGAYNTNNLEWTRAELRAAEETRTPLLIQVSTGAAKYMGGYKFVKDMVADQMDSMNISVPWDRRLGLSARHSHPVGSLRLK